MNSTQTIKLYRVNTFDGPIWKGQKRVAELLQKRLRPGIPVTEVKVTKRDLIDLFNSLNPTAVKS